MFINCILLIYQIPDNLDHLESKVNVVNIAKAKAVLVDLKEINDVLNKAFTGNFCMEI